MWTKCRETCLRYLPPIEPYLQRLRPSNDQSPSPPLGQPWIPPAARPPTGPSFPYPFPSSPQGNNTLGKKTSARNKPKGTLWSIRELLWTWTTGITHISSTRVIFALHFKWKGKLRSWNVLHDVANLGQDKCFQLSIINMLFKKLWKTETLLAFQCFKLSKTWFHAWVLARTGVPSAVANPGPNFWAGNWKPIARLQRIFNLEVNLRAKFCNLGSLRLALRHSKISCVNISGNNVWHNCSPRWWLDETTNRDEATARLSFPKKIGRFRTCFVLARNPEFNRVVRAQMNL